VVLGFFGMTLVAPLIREYLGAPTGLTAFTGALILAYMSLPTIISMAEDALDSVPKSYRDAGLAMGATKWQTIWRVVVPAARSGIVTAVMLGMGRAIGETMAVMMVTGNAARIPTTLDSIFRPVRTTTATIAAEMGEVAQGSTHYHVLFGLGIILFALTFIINLTAATTIFKKRRRGGLR
jgi:phosphate transport system permease protein